MCELLYKGISFIVLGLHGAPDVMKHAEKLVCQIVEELKEAAVDAMTDCSRSRRHPARHREINLPMKIKPEQVKASFRDGILEVRLPKLVVVNAQRVTVEIRATDPLDAD